MTQSAKIDHEEPKDPTVPSDKHDTDAMAAQATETPQTPQQSGKYARLKLRFEALKKVGLCSTKNLLPQLAHSPKSDQ